MMKQKRMFWMGSVVGLVVSCVVLTGVALAQTDDDVAAAGAPVIQAETAQAVEVTAGNGLSGGAQIGLFASIAAVVGISCISAGYAVAKVGAAALGAASEKPEILGRALILVGLAEGVAIYGLIIGIMLIVRLL